VLERQAKGIVLMLASVALIVVIFRAAYEQQGNTLALWAQGVERGIGDWTIPMTWFQSLNPLLVFLMSPLLIASWTRRAARSGEVPPLRRMATGAALVAGSFLVLAAADSLGAQQVAGLGWMALVAFFVLNTLGELYILPVGLSLFGRLAPRGLESTLIALWFLASFGGNLAAGVLGTLWSTLSHAEFFTLTASVSLASALGLLVMNAGARGRLDT
jgi:POT family proton-dependent oligopeptide transporter